MPSPFMRRQANTSTTDVERPIEPIPEHYAGDVFPYRGTEPHGVEPNAESHDVPTLDEGHEVVYDAEPHEQEPVPVRVVNESGRELRAFRTYLAYPGGTGYGVARAIVGKDEDRTSVRIKNFSASRVWIGSDPQSATAFNGYPLDTGNEFASNAQTPIYATTEGADGLPVSVYVEYAQPLRNG